MHLLIDALSVNNLSGRHVLAGHVGQLVDSLEDRCRFTVLVGNSNAGSVSSKFFVVCRYELFVHVLPG